LVVQPGVAVSADEPAAAHVESVLAVNPREQRNLIAAVITFARERSGVVVYFSRDGGRSWTRAMHGIAPLLSPGLDPDLVFDSTGRAYLVSAGDHGLTVWTSDDGGGRWAGPTNVPGAWDRPWISVDPAGTVRILGKLPITVMGAAAQDTLALVTSRDEGRTFDFPALVLPPPQTHLLNVPSSFQQLPNGTLLVVLQVFAPDQVRRQGRSVLVGHYDTVDLAAEQGLSMSSGPEFHTYGHGWEGKSAFGYGFAHTVVDRTTGRRAGRLYMAYLDVVDHFFRVMVASSTDSGATWSPAVIVSSATTATDASNPAIAVDGEGNVGVVWNDRTSDPTNRCYRPFFSASFDGAATFTPGRPVSDALACPLHRAAPGHPEIDPIESTERFKNGGETQGIVGLQRGFQLAWIGGSAELGLWSTRVEVAAAPH
jgi:hypothetical protein